MEIVRNTLGDTAVLHLNGRLDLNSSAEVKNRIKELLDKRSRKIILNLTRVDFINSSGLGVLISVLKDIRLANSRLAITNLSPYVHEIFEITQLVNVFDIYDNEEAALDGFLLKSGDITG
jgi:anti-sigma B factor antagonist